MKGVTKNPLGEDFVEHKPDEHKKYLDEFALTIVEAQRVVFQGRAFAIHVIVKSPSEDVPTINIARAILGNCIKTLIKNPACLDRMTQQNITKTVPLTPKVTFDLDSIVLYAVSSSSDPGMAQAMALDRIALFLSACKGQVHGVKDALEAHGISLAQKA